MNIKGLLGNILSITPISSATKAEKAIKSDSTSDRDANGQQAGGGEEQQREPMSDEQLEKALEQLRNLSGVKEHQWKVELVTIEGKKFVLVKDINNQTIRRIPEIELWTLESDSKQGKGQLLKKTA
ncbi:MAG: hypothetical protein IPM97_13965 [Bdellovibrionaceae bacterium]|nr:hypothetical protein [Pseudobdellovibrionaceae bacterium]